MTTHPTMPAIPASATAPVGTPFRIPRRHESPRPFRVRLRPLMKPWETHEAVGYLFADLVDGSVTPELLAWTSAVVAQLQPSAFLAFRATPEAVMSTEFARICSHPHRFRVVLDDARMGRRRDALVAARDRAVEFGAGVVVTGHRTWRTEGFGAVMVTPSTAAVDVHKHHNVDVFATGISTPADLDWARQIGASCVEGPAIAAPLEMAPVDLARIRKA